MLADSNAIATVAVKDLEAAERFYGDRLGLAPEHREGDEVITYRSGSTLLNVYRSKFAGTNRATGVSRDVAAIEGEVRDLKARGVVFEHHDMPGMKLQGDLHVGAGMKVAWFKDPDGNILGLTGR